MAEPPPAWPPEPPAPAGLNPLPPLPPAPGLRLRPLGFGELLDEIFRVYRRHFWLFVSIALLLALPSLFLQILSGQADQVGFSASLLSGATGGSGQDARPPDLNLVALGLQYLLAIALIPFAEGAIALAAIDTALGRPVTLASCFRRVLRRYWGLLGVSLLGVVLLPLFFCLPVFVWILVRWSMAVPALLAERRGPVQAIRRSWELTRGHWWRLFGILLVVVLIQLVMNSLLGAAGLPIAIVIPFVSNLVRGAVAVTVSTLGTALVTPILYLCVVLLYFDLRIRKESFDLDQLAAQVGGEPQA
ncbi:MAG: glycerophosphoryl diester phosphodiesterase membrane domain-containing protein [Candidatus Dormibacteraeota bacterium]|jgi:Membrane domain of glycerophosphoryl diester phosphodiesterase|nr:glycerophosphoryl diester phosphodiesterase membrane domain-containing protein [Candidatus Dormibacteraeota bacterium]